MSGVERSKQILQFENIATSIVHDLKTPLNLINAVTKDSSLTNSSIEDYKQSLSHIGNISSQALNLVNDLLFVLNIQQNKSQLPLFPMSARAEFSEVISQIQPLLVKYNVSLKKKNSFNKQTLLHANQQAVRRLLFNLANNAVQHSSPGSNISFKSNDTKTYAEYMFLNRGPALNNKDIKSLEGDLQTLPTKLSAGQSGLGLYLINRLSDILHCKIDFYREDDQNVFTLKIPVIKQQLLFS